MVLFLFLNFVVTLITSLPLILLITILLLKARQKLKYGVCKSNARLDGKVAIVTGGNAGIGLETARDLASRGARVVIACRNEERAKEAVADIISSTENEKVYFIRLDLSKFSCINKFVEDFKGKFERLDILVNNAGLYSEDHIITEDGIDLVTQCNYVGPFMLTHKLLDILEASAPSRIVIVSSDIHNVHVFDPDDLVGNKYYGYHKYGYHPRYANSKLCNILWARALAKRLPDGVTVNALHPGTVNTSIYTNFRGFGDKVNSLVLKNICKTPEEGAQTVIQLCVAPELEMVSGEYFAECKIKQAHKDTYDENLIEKVWNETVKLIHLNSTF